MIVPESFHASSEELPWAGDPRIKLKLLMADSCRRTLHSQTIRFPPLPDSPQTTHCGCSSFSH